MSAQWSSWTTTRDGRSFRTFRAINGIDFYQWDNSREAIRDSNGSTINRRTAQLLQIPLDTETPRTADLPNAQNLDQSRGRAIVSTNDYEVRSRRQQRRTNVTTDESKREREARAEEAENDGLGPLPSNMQRVVLDPSKMSGKPRVGTEKEDLVSVRTTGSLPDSYNVELNTFFVLGRVFRVLWVEPKGTTANDYSRDDDTYISLRPVIVVKRGGSHCICVPIYSYGRQGVGKPGLTENEVQHHAVVHMKDRTPRLVQGEEKWQHKIKVADAFTVEPGSNPSASLSASSRIRFDSPLVVNYNVKVFDLGRIILEHRPRLQTRYRNATI